jgi:hypothetical protein
MNDNVQKLSFVKLLHDFTLTQAQNHFHISPKLLPCHVSKILENDFLELTFDVTGPFTLPKISVPQTFSKYHREPTQVGDKGYTTASSNYLGGESGQSGGTASLYSRGNLTTSAFQPVSEKSFPKRDPNMYLQTGGPSGHTLQSADGTTTKVIDSVNNIIHTSSAAIQHVAQGIISHIAHGGITYAAMGSAMNLVQETLHIGKPSSMLFDLQNPPTPTEGVQVNVMGSLTASVSISAGSMSLPGGSVPSSSDMNSAISSAVANYVPIPVPIPVVTGDTAGNTALISLIAALVTVGIIIDNTTDTPP